MARKQFKTETKKLLDMMINSIYTHKEVFLRELISNASDACDKLYFRSLTDSSVEIKRDEYVIRISVNRDDRTIVISDNGCGMSKEELESNLGTIAKSGSYDFKNDKEAAEKVDIIGQFGVGFYSAFMVCDAITVDSKVYGSDEAYRWFSKGIEGYTVDPCEKASNGTEITLKLKEDGEDENYSTYLEEWTLRELVKKYSDYIRYPIKMMVSKSRRKEGSPDDKPEYESYMEDETLNSMIPLWKKNAKDVTEEEYNTFYREKFNDYEAPVKVITQKAEGMSEYSALLFVPSHAPYNYYTRDFEKGLQLYSNGVLIMEKCKDLLPDYYSFVNGIVDSSDLSLNISREMLQHDRQLKIIAKGIEKKITNELKKLIENDREKYEKFYNAFGTQLKYGLYANYGANKATLSDLVMFRSSFENKLVSFKEYVSRMKEDQKKIFYAPGETYEQIALLPQVEAVKSKGYEVLYLTEDVDEFALQMIRDYDEKEFSNICQDDLDLSTEEEKDTLKKANDESKDLFKVMKEAIGDSVAEVAFTNMLAEQPVALSAKGGLSINMVKQLNKMPGDNNDNPVKAEILMEVNMNHPIAEKLKGLYNSDEEKLKKYSKVLYNNARLISGLQIENPSEFGNLICDLMLD